MARRDFDVVILGSGVAGRTVAKRCRAAGRQVAVVDSRPFGGTCALRGCDPKRVLLGAAEVVDEKRRLAERGVRGQLVVDWPALMRFKRSFTDPVPDEVRRKLTERDIAPFYGRARFVSEREVQVGSDVLRGERVVVATGAKPRPLHIPGSEHVVTSDMFLELAQLPRRVVFVGGGYVSFELAHLCARAGADVTVLHRGARPLRCFDPDLVDRLVERTRSLGVHVELGAEVRAIQRENRHLQVYADARGRPRAFETDLVVHGAGRVADLDDLDLERAGVARDERGVVVNEHLESVSNPRVYAAGDAASSGPSLTPAASVEGKVVAHNLVEDEPVSPDYRGVASVCFSIPPIAAVGLSEEAARARGGGVRVDEGDASGWFRVRRVREPCAAFKVIVDEERDRVLGAHVLGPGAEELINVFALAIRADIPVTTLRETPFAYPTSSSDLGRMMG